MTAGAALDPILAGMLAGMAEAGLPAIADCTPTEARAMALARRAARSAPARPEIGLVENVVVATPHGRLAARLYLPMAAPAGIIVYFHGGGWVLGDLESADAVAHVLVAASGWGVLSVDYRLAPEHRFPAPLDDAWAAVQWAAAQYKLPIMVGGDSAGANLATASALRARDAGGPRLAGQILFYPVTDHDFDTPSYRENGGGGYSLSTRDMRWFWDCYADAEQRRDPQASPLRAGDLSGMPPTFLVAAGYDPLRDEGIAYAERLRAAGAAVTLRRYDSMIHGFVLMIGIVDQAEQAVREAGCWAAQVTSTA